MVTTPFLLWTPLNRTFIEVAKFQSEDIISAIFFRCRFMQPRKVVEVFPLVRCTVFVCLDPVPLDRALLSLVHNTPPSLLVLAVGRTLY